MKNITFSADEKQIERARARARERRTTLNEEFRRWIAEYSAKRDDGPERAAKAMALLDEILSYTSTGGRKYTREEMNER
ncbi:MAG: hypothetical protein M0R73_07485 [Dehalococcoidia bacterium]|nr:hypothetical protein [Dehalococcoidia bacterium]